MAVLFDANEYRLPAGDKKYEVLTKIVSDEALFSDMVKSLSTHSMDMETQKRYLRLCELLEFSGVVSEIFEIGDEPYMRGSSDERKRLAESYAMHAAVLRTELMPFIHESNGVEKKLTIESDHIPRIRVYHLKGVEVLSYIGFIPLSVIEDDVEHDDLDYYGYEEDGKPMGLAVTMPDYDSIRIRYITIAEGFRGCGRGRRFLLQLCALLYDKTEVIAAEVVDRDRYYLHRLLEICGFKGKKNGCSSFSFNTGDVHPDAVLIRNRPNQVMPLKSVSPRIIGRLWGVIDSAGLAFCPQPQSGIYDFDISAIYIDGDNPLGIILASSDEERVTVRYIYSLTKEPQVFIQLVSYFARAVVKLRGRRITFDVVNEKLTPVIERLLGVRGNYQYTMSYDRDIFLKDMQCAYTLMQDFEGAGEVMAEIGDEQDSTPDFSVVR